MLFNAIMARFHEKWTLVCIRYTATGNVRIDRREVFDIFNFMVIWTRILDFPQFI